MVYFSPEMTEEEAKKIYRRECVKLHPDKPTGNQVEFVKMQTQYESYLKGTLNYTSKQAKDEAGALADFINANEFIKAFEGVTVELTGTWVWLSGNTFPYKDEIKKHGFKFSRGKKKWYKSPEGSKTKKRGKGVPFEKIQQRYGYEAMTMHSDTKQIR